jgi:hypothetical protein
MDRKVNRKKEMLAGEQGDEIDDNKLAKEAEGEQDKWEEEKSNKEVLEIFNHRRASVHYLQAAIQVSDAQVTMNDKQHETGVTQITEIAKMPKEVASEFFQASAVSKVVTQKLPGYEFKEKTTITSSEILAYIKSIVKENGFFTFGAESDRLGKLISKLHRYMKTYLTSYAAKCLGEVADYVEITDVAEVPKNIILG